MSTGAEELRRAAARASHAIRHVADRLAHELEFAEALCALHPREARSWRALIRRAAEKAAPPLDGAKADDARAAVTQAEQLLAPIGRAAKRYTVHCVGHAHIDMNWMWSWPETVAVTHDTFATVLRLMEEYPAFTFSQSQASVYAILEKHSPEMLEQVRRRVREGRWEVTASHWVEGDKNLAGAESLCRHLLYTRRYMARLFGLEPEAVPVDWSPDTFGHAATVPTYLARGAVRYYYLHRPGLFTQPQPRTFWWQGADGARVLVRNDADAGYNGKITPALGMRMIGFAQETGAPLMLFVYGVGDHGGGPTRRDILQALEMDAWPVFPRVIFSTVRAFFEALEQANPVLPVLRGELNTEFAGCYTTQSLIKKCNRYGETRLCDAEAAATLAWAALGFPCPAGDLTEGWQDTLFSHFHDILPGSGVHDTRTYTHGLYQKTMAMTSMVETRALRLLAARADTSAAPDPAAPTPGSANALGAGAGFHSVDGQLSAAEQSIGAGPRPFLLFNPTDADRREVVEATIWDNTRPGADTPLKERPFAVRRPDGSLLPAQPVAHGNYWGHEYLTLAFPAAVRRLGYAVCTVVERQAPAGDLPAEASFLDISPAHAILCGLKKAEEDDALILRLFETGGRRVDARIRLNAKMLGRPLSAVEVDLMERPLANSTARAAHDAVRVTLPARGIVSVRVTLKRP